MMSDITQLVYTSQWSATAIRTVVGTGHTPYPTQLAAGVSSKCTAVTVFLRNDRLVAIHVFSQLQDGCNMTALRAVASSVTHL